MGTAIVTSCSCFPWRINHQIVPSHHVLLAHASLEKGCSRRKAIADSRESGCLEGEVSDRNYGLLTRREAIVSGVGLVSSAVLVIPREGLAVVKQGPLAGRIPGLSEPDEQGLFGLFSLSYTHTYIHTYISLFFFCLFYCQRKIIDLS